MDPLISTKPYISMMVAIAEIDSPIDVESVFIYLPINETFLGIKFHDKIRGDIKPTGSFYNQVSIIVYLKDYDKKVNLKLFANGKVQFSGIKINEHALTAFTLFVKEISKISGKKIVNTITIDGIIYNKAEFEDSENQSRTRFNSIKIYSYNSSTNVFSIVGEKKRKDFVIKNDSVCIYGDYFVQTKHLNYIRKLFNKNGDYIGCIEYFFTRKRKNVVMKDYSMEKISEFEYNIFDKYKKFIGTQKIYIERDIVIPDFSERKNIMINYSAIKSESLRNSILSGDFFIPEEDLEKKIKFKITNINCNFEINIGDRLIERTILHDIFNEDYKLNSYFNNESRYQAINLKLYFDKNMKMIHNKEDYAHKVTLLFFQNGKIIISGCTSKNQIIIVKKTIMGILNEIKDKIFQRKKIDVKIIDSEISIWDLI